MTSLYLSLTCHDKYTSPSWPSSLRSIVSDVTTYCLCLDMTYIIYISMQLITIKSIRNCDVSVFLFVLTWQIHQIHFDQAHQDQVYEMFGLPCICLYLDMTNTPSTFRSSSSRSKVSDVVTSGLVGHTVGIQKASSSQRIPTPQTILFLLLFSSRFEYFSFLEVHLNKYWCNRQSFFSQSDLDLLHWEVYEFNMKDS